MSCRAIVLGLLLGGAGPGIAACSKPATHTVVMEATRFQTDVLTVKAGDSVVWVNKDMFPHTATSQPGRFDSGSIDADASWTLQTKARGEFAYICSFHPTMKATLRVE